MAETDCKRLHIVMFPWLAFGHILPFLELSKRIAQKGHFISFISTPRNIERLPKIPPNLSPLINLVKLSLPHIDNLPNDAEATMDLPYNEVQLLKKAFDGLKEPFTRFLGDINFSPDWIIFDFAHHWLPSIAVEFNVPCIFFSIFNASSISFFGPPSVLLGTESEFDERSKMEQFTVPAKWVPFPTTVAFRLHEIKKIFNGFEENASGISDAHRMAFSVSGCDFVAVRSCLEVEGDWLRLLQEVVYGKPVIPVGHLPPSTTGIDTGDERDEKWVPIGDWLDKQKEGSVLYVAFGSEATLSREEITELAHGLELSGLPFFWVLRKPSGLTVDNDPVELPPGFEERTRSCGVVWRSWAPQVRILGHVSIGGFLTHSGWSSVIEGGTFGRVLILLPLMADQGLIARLLQEKKIGLEIERNEEDGSFTRESVAKTLRLVMVEEEGFAFRSKAKEIRELFGNKERHDRYVDDFVKYLQDHRRPNSKIPKSSPT